jgi:hypothetical protein
MIALLVLAALAMVAAVIAGIVALVVAVIRHAMGRHRQRRNLNTGSIGGLPPQDALSREDAEFRRIVHQEWPSA